MLKRVSRVEFRGTPTPRGPGFRRHLRSKSSRFLPDFTDAVSPEVFGFSYFLSPASSTRRDNRPDPCFSSRLFEFRLLDTLYLISGLCGLRRSDFLTGLSAGRGS